MIHPLVKLITVDGFMSTEQSESLFNSVKNLQYTESEFGKQIENFNLLAPDVDEQFTLKWNDPKINISWPIKNPLLSLRDNSAKLL
jgi:dTDP-4-dehydrorhamnose 3,5-epimerase-like enzyme